MYKQQRGMCVEPFQTELLLMRRFRQEEGFLARLKRMASGEERMNRDLIQYVDPRKFRVKPVEEVSTESESDAWVSPAKGSQSRHSRMDDSSDEMPSKRVA